MSKPKRSDMKAEPIVVEDLTPEAQHQPVLTDEQVAARLRQEGRQEGWINDEMVEAAHIVTGYVPAMLRVALVAASPIIYADLRKRLLSDEVLDEAADQLNELSGGPDSWDAFTLAKTAISAALGTLRTDPNYDGQRDTAKR